MSTQAYLSNLPGKLSFVDRRIEVRLLRQIETAVKAMGVKGVCVPNWSSKSPERNREQKKR